MTAISMTAHAQQRAHERRIGLDEIKICAAMGKEVCRDEESRTVKFHKLCLIVSVKTGEIVTVFRTETDKRRAKAKRKKQRKIKLHDKHLRRA